MIRTSVLIILTLIAQLTFAQLTQTIRGSIVDQDSEFPLPGATIMIINSDPLIGTTTDIDGNFRLDNVAVGRYDFQISYVGYEPKTLKEIVVGSGKEVVLNVLLKESSVNLNEFVVKAEDMKNTPLNSMATVSARVLSVEEARRYAGGFDDPARLASSFAGVATNSFQDNGIIVRGNAPKGMLWQLEGIQIANPTHLPNLQAFGGGAVTALSSNMLANSDFFTGAFPAEYGNAMSGVFDIKLRTGNNERYEHAVQMSLQGLDVSSEGPLNKKSGSSYLFNYRYMNYELLRPMLPEEMKALRYQDLSFKFNFPTKAGVFSIWALGAQDYTRSAALEDTAKWEHEADRKNFKGRFAMGAIGLSHKKILGKNTLLNSTLAFSGSKNDFDQTYLMQQDVERPDQQVYAKNWKYTFKSYVNHKFGSKHTNRTGLILNRLEYDLDMNQHELELGEMVNFVNSADYTYLYQVFSQSNISLHDKLDLNAGAYFQYFQLNEEFTIEPRVSLKYQMSPVSSLSLAYGKHSQVEMLNIYLARPFGGVQANKDLGLMKAHHFVVSYDRQLNENSRIIIEPYYQMLYDVPVEKGTSYSLINLENDWFLTQQLVNNGEAKNYGIDFTLERFLNKGFYYLITASYFESKYVGGDNIERDTRWNRNYVVNFLAGKEWVVGRKKSNVIGINGKFTFAGGTRISPLDLDASYAKQDIIYDETRAFEDTKPGLKYLDFTLNYRINKEKHASIWSLQLINALGTKDFFGYQYNYKYDRIDKDEDVIFIPNISYKIEF